MTLALKHIAIDEMKVSPLNMRHARKAPNIDDIYPSIRKRGVLETMLVRREGETWGVVAGRRRYFALRRKQKETGKKQKAPCAVMKPGDDMAAAEASLIENIALPPDEFQQYNAFKRLADKGAPVAEIAEVFGVTPLKVNRILALAGLRKEIKSLYEEEAIDRRTLQALTLASDEQQRAWLDLYHDKDEYEPRGDRLKAWLAGGERISTDKALFDLTAYDGAIIADLFGDDAIFGDAATFWKAQNEAIGARVEALKSKGWKDVVILERGEHFCSWDHVKRGRTSGGKVFVEVRHDGGVQFHEGYLSKADAKKIDAILKGESDGDAARAAPQKPEMSAPLADYVGLHRHAAVRAELMRHPGVALRFAVAHLIIGSSLWRVDIEKQSTRKEATAESIAKSEGESLFAEARAEACAALGFEDADSGLVRRNGDEWALACVFRRLLDLDDKTVLSILAVAMGETLVAGSSLVEALTHAIPVDMTALWKPDEAFFDLLRDKRAVNAMVAEIAGRNVAKSSLTDTCKVQKEIIRNRIAGHGCEPNPDWRPRWMQVPARSYFDDEGCAPAKNAARIADAMTAEAENAQAV